MTDDQILTVIPSLRRYAWKLAGRDGAEDLVQDVLEKILRKRHLYREGNFTAWCMTIMHNEFMNTKQQEGRRVAAESVDDPTFRAVLSACDRADIAAVIFEARSALAALSTEKRQVLFAIIFACETYDEAAEQLGISVGTVRSRLHRAREQLKAADIL